MKVEIHKRNETDLDIGTVDVDFEYENVTTDDIPFKYLQKLQQMGLKTIRVQVRQTGISSEGEQLKCHGNVVRMVQKYGGMRLEGHEVLIGEDDEYGTFIECFSHSVWITKENKITCISKSNYEVNSKRSEISDKRVRDRGYMIFIPRILYVDCKETITFRYFDFSIIGNIFGLLNTDGKWVEHKGNKQGLKLRGKYFGTKNDWNTSKELLKMMRVLKLDNMLKDNHFLQPKQNMFEKIRNLFEFSLSEEVSK